MKKIECHFNEEESIKIYRYCAELSKDEIKNQILEYENDVEELTKKYYKKEFFVDLSVMDKAKLGKDKKEVNKLYKDIFREKLIIRTKYYDVILGNDGDTTCPICGCGKIKNLDHFFPESKYQLLCVTPLNLIPTCIDCNFAKRDKIFEECSKIPLNPYFDDIKEKWLKCSIEIYKGTLITNFDVSEKVQNRLLYERCKSHMDIYKLNETFQNAARNHIINSMWSYLQVYRSGSREGLEVYLNEALNSYNKIDENSWISSLYSGLLEKLDVFCNYISLRLQDQGFINDVENKSLGYSVNDILTAISQNKKIKFKYNKFKNDDLICTVSKDYILVSPWAIYFGNKYYYTIAFDDTDGRIKKYQVDRMLFVKISEEDRMGENEFYETCIDKILEGDL